MSDNNSSRRKFLQLLGLTASSTLINTSAIAGFIDQTTIHKLNPEQQEFMLRYGKWMDEFIEVIHIQKKEPDNIENKHKMIALTEMAEKFNPELSEFMKDQTFSLIYNESILRMTNTI